MNTEKTYIKPRVETIDIEVETIIAGSIAIQSEEVSGIARGKERNFWE